jgi:hypothetical protein
MAPTLPWGFYEPFQIFYLLINVRNVYISVGDPAKIVRKTIISTVL